MKKFLSILVVAIFSLTYASTVYAKSTTEAEAEELKTMISDYMGNIKKTYGNVPNVNMEYDGELSITPKDDYYQILLPKISFGGSNPNNPADALSLLLDSVAINASKQSDDSWSLSIAIPTPIKAIDGNDKTVFNVNIGEQNASMLFIPSLLTAPKYRFSYKNITIESLAGDNLKINIGEFFSRLKLDDNAQGLWSGPANAYIKDVSMVSNNLNLNIESIKTDGVYTDFDLKLMSSFTKKIMGMNLSSGEAAEDEAMKLFNDSFSNMFTSMGGINADISINGFNSSYIDPETNKTDNFSFAKAALGFGWNGLRTNSASLEFSALMNSMATSDIPADTQGLVPSLAEIKMRVTKLPVQSLLKMLEDKIHNIDNQSQGVMGAIGLLTEAGTTLVIDKNNMESPEFGIISYGEVTANNKAPMKAVADFTLKLRNLDAVIAKYSKLETTPPQLKQMLGLAPMFQAMGTQETDANGSPVRSYNLQLTDGGKILLNGSDMGPMMGMSPPPEEQQPPQ